VISIFSISLIKAGYVGIYWNKLQYAKYSSPELSESAGGA